MESKLVVARVWGEEEQGRDLSSLEQMNSSHGCALPSHNAFACTTINQNTLCIFVIFHTALFLIKELLSQQRQ